MAKNILRVLRFAVDPHSSVCINQIVCVCIYPLWYSFTRPRSYDLESHKTKIYKKIYIYTKRIMNITFTTQYCTKYGTS